MAEALISVVLEQLASIIHQQVQQQVKLVVDVEKEVLKLTRSFRAIEPVLKDAEERQVKEASVRFWLDSLKDVSYEVEDVLDEWNIEILWLPIEKEGGNAPVATTNNVSLCIPAPFFCSSQVSRVIFRHDIAGKIQELNERLALIATDRHNYNFQYTKSGGIEQIKRQKTTSFVDKTFGRVYETELLVSMLLSESSHEAGTTPVVISIVGMGGIGKTTIAQLAYNDERVKANFTKTIWVCVSDPFDEINIAKAIIEELNKNDAPNSNDLQALWKCVNRNTKGQKFLLVLDDVWNQDYIKWEKLRLPLQNGAIGSKIIVTTRKEEVAMMMGALDKTINLKVLSDKNCWLLFCQIALANRKQDGCKDLEAIGIEIVKKCKGLPLVAKTLGGLMRYKKTKKEWQDVLSNKIWELEEVEHQVFQPLLLSYYDLPPSIKQCLLYCVIFPKGHNIYKYILIESWMSQGYISSNENKENTMLDIGELYFDYLVTRSFFQHVVKDEGENIIFCKMHDIVHDFLQFLTKDECFAIETKGSEERIVLPAGNKFRHLTMSFAPEGQFPVSFDNCKSLRTIATFSCKFTSLTLGPELILRLKCVRTLNLSNQLREVPKEVGGLVHLRYLGLAHNSWLKKLPDTLCNLVNLQTLRLENCRNLEELPKDMGKLTNLRHLHVQHCYDQMKLPKTIGRLTSLQILEIVNIWGDDVIEGVFKLSDLRNMDQLWGSLTIRWRKESKDAASDALKAKLVNKKRLLRLRLIFWGSDSGSIIQEEILSALQPNPTLESLNIDYYSGTTLCPHWMKNMSSSLNNLTSLIFSHCGLCEFVPLSDLGNLRSLETLRFANMYKVKKVEFESSSASSSSPEQVQLILFPSLKHLQFVGMPKWEEWSEDQDLAINKMNVMPYLSTLTINSCDKLKALPHFLQPRKLIIKNCQILLQSSKNRPGKGWPNISHIPNIQIDGVWI